MPNSLELKLLIGLMLIKKDTIMKKLVLSIFAVALSWAMNSCSSDNSESLVPSNNELTASLELVDGSRTTLDTNCKVSWDKDDKISVNGVNYKAKSAGNFATFEKEGAGDAPTGALTAYYPESLKDKKLKEAQDYKSEKISNNPMYAYAASGTNLEFKNICGLLEFSLTGSGSKMSKIVVTANEALNGEFTITDNAAVLNNTKVEDKNKKVTLNMGNGGISLSSTAQKFYIALPAGTYTGFKVAFCKNDKKVEKTATKNVTIARNKIYQLSFSGIVIPN